MSAQLLLKPVKLMLFGMAMTMSGPEKMQMMCAMIL